MSATTISDEILFITHGPAAMTTNTHSNALGPRGSAMVLGRRVCRYS